MRSLVAPGLTNKPWAVSSFQLSPPPSPPPRPAPAALTLLKATANTLNGAALGGGKYAGRVLAGTTTLAANSTNLTMPEGLTVPGADDCMIVNLAESGRSTHLLTDAANPSPYVMGFAKGTVTITSGGVDTTYPVYWVDANRLYLCT